MRYLKGQENTGRNNPCQQPLAGPGRGHRATAQAVVGGMRYWILDSVTLKSAEASFQQVWREAMASQTKPVLELWEGI